MPWACRVVVVVGLCTVVCRVLVSATGLSGLRSGGRNHLEPTPGTLTRIPLSGGVVVVVDTQRAAWLHILISRP